MPVTLAEASLNAATDLDANVIDEFRKQSGILDALPFHDAVSAMGGGSTLTYGYHRVVAQRGADFRAVNAEYVPQEAGKQRYTVDLKPLGGSYQIDRVLAGIARGAEVTFQMQQLIKGTVAKFTDELINGDTDVDSNGFDGLNKALRGTITEVGADTITDWSNIDSSGYQNSLDAVDALFGWLDGPPTLVIANQYALAKFRAIARRASAYVESPVNGLQDPYGNPIMRQQFGNVTLIDAGAKPGSTDPIIPIETRDPDGSNYTVTVNGSPTGGTFTLSVTVGGVVEQTDPIAYDATNAVYKSTIEGNDNVPGGSVTISGTSPKTIAFGGELTDEVVTVALGANSLTGGTTPTVAIATSGSTTTYSGTTDIYVVRMGMDGFHGVSPAGQPLLRQWLPDFERAGAVKTGEVEMGPVAAVLKATRAAAVLRNVKIR
jgi:hypothetical protein